MDTASPPDDDVVSFRRRSTISSSHYSSTASSSSPEFTTDAVITPDSESDLNGTEIVPKIEELEDSGLDGIEDAKPIVKGEVTIPARKRGRPRKHPIVDQKKSSHARSKTGCGTCRRRKKKCDERKPSCLACEKNNVVCDGYEPKQPWRSGKDRTIIVRPSSIPTELPMLVDGIDGAVDQMFFQHFTCNVSKVLSLNDHHNPFLDHIVPMSMSHAGLMHSLLYLSGSCLVAKSPNANWEWEERQAHHSGQAISLLMGDIQESSSSTDGDTSSLAAIGDPTIAQTLILCLQTVCAGDRSGSYRFHLDAMKQMLTQRQRTFPNEHLRQFILEFLIYHDYSSSITSLHNSLDQRSIDLMSDFQLPEYMIQPQAGTLLGVLDGLFGFISRIRHLRDQIRSRRAAGLHWWDDQIMKSAFDIDNALREWTCIHPPSSPRYAASLLYRQCTWIYLYRTTRHSRASPGFANAVDQGLVYLRLLPDNDSTNSILLMPLFLLGCAAFETRQRPEVSKCFERLQEWSSLGNIRYAREIVEQVWGMMDEGREEETWDWEGIIAKRGWDFLVT